MKKLRAALLACGLVALPSLCFSATNQDVYNMVKSLSKEVKELKQENQNLQKEIQELKVQKDKERAGFYSMGAYGVGKSKIEFYGYIKGDLIWQDSSSVGTIYLLWALPKKQGEHDSKSTITFRQTRFGFLLTKSYKTFTIKGRIEMDFYSESHDEKDFPWNPQHAPLRARRAYLKVIKGSWSLLVGHEWMTIAQLYPHLSNFPAGTYMGNLGYRLTQIRVTKNFRLPNKDLFKIQVALDKPYDFGKMNGVVIFDNEPNTDFGMPGIEARVAYQTKLFSRPTLFALFGHWSGQEYKKYYDFNKLSGAIKTTSFSTGLELRLPLPILTRFKPTISGEFWYGQGLGGYYAGAVGQTARIEYSNGTSYFYATDLKHFDPSKDYIVSVSPIHAVGGWVELGLKPLPKLQSWFGWGIDNPSDKDLAGVKYARLQQQMYYTHFLYRFVPEFGTGFEYLRVKTDYRKNDGGDGIVNRFMLSFYYFF